MFLKKQRPEQTKSEIVTTSICDYFSLLALDFKEFHLTLGDQVGRVMLITDFPPQVQAGWLSRLFNMPGVVGSLHLIPSNSEELVQEINRAISDFRTRLATGSNSALVVQRTEQNLRDAQTLQRKVDTEEQQVFTVVVILLVFARDLDELNKQTRRLEATAGAFGLRARTLNFLQRDGLKAAGPWAVLPEAVKETAPRYMPSETVAGAFPFVGGTINHGSGVYLGRDGNGGLVIFDRWSSPEDVAIRNPNMTVHAAPGVGKSFSVKLMLLREYMLGAKVIILDPEREYKDLCQRLGGSWVNAAGGGGCINPLQIRSLPENDAAGDSQENAMMNRPMLKHLQRLRTFFALYLRDLTDLEKANLEDALVALYQSFGITWGTDPAQVEVWPTTRDLYRYVLDQSRIDCGRWERLALLLRAAGEGADSSLWAGQSSVEADSDFIVIDVHDHQPSEDGPKRAQYFNVLTYAWDVIRKDPAERKMLVVDEAWLLADPKVPQALDFLRDLSKRIRKYRGSLTLISQNVADFLVPEVAHLGEAVLSSASMKLFLRQSEKEMQVLPRLLSLSEAEQDLIFTAKRGEGLFVAGNQRVRVQLEAAPHELAIIDPQRAALHGISDEEGRV